MTRELAAELVTRGVNLPVQYRSEDEERPDVARPQIVVQRRPNADTVTRGPARNDIGNAFVRNVAIRVEIYTQSTVSGAAIQNHHREVEALADVVLVSLDKVIRSRRSDWTITTAGLMSAAERERGGQVNPNGAAFAIECSVMRGIAAAAKYAGQDSTIGKTTTTVTGVGLDSTTRIKISGTDGAGDTACGG